MATASIAVPPMNKISIIGIWIESVLYGFNCVVYGLAMFVLLRRGTTIPRNRVLVLISTILFILCTVHVAASLRQLLEAFVYVPADVPDYSTIYWLDPASSLGVLKEVLYDTLVFIQDIVLMWRLYIVFDCNWKIMVFPILLEATHMSASYAATIIYTIDPGISLYDSIVARLGLTGWALDITVNASLTLVIAARLWSMGRTAASFYVGRPTENRYLASVYVIVESGGLFAGTTIVMLALYVDNDPVTLTGLDIASQLAVLTPLLIVVRVGLGLTHSLKREYESTSRFGVAAGQSMRNRHPRVPASVSTETEHEVELNSISMNSCSFVNDMKV